MGIADIVAGIFKPVADVIDHLTVSGEDKARIQLAVVSGQIAASQSVMDYERQLLEGQQKVIAAEASSNNWLASSWRPITMLTFLALVVANSLGWLHEPLAPQAWSLLQIGLGGYTVGRSAEKIAPIIAQVLKK
jgi:Holin of 3TMs, for gene-transfer release